MFRRFLLLLSLFFTLSFLFAYSQTGSVLSDVTVTASIPSADLIPPTINFISPVNLQQNVPADADIQVDVFDPFSGVDINTIYFSINGTIYLASSPFVTITGDPSLYHVTVHPFSPLFVGQTNTVITFATDIAGNRAQLTITFNSPTPTITPSPTSSPNPNPTSTPGPSPSPTPTIRIIRPTSTYPIPTTCPVCPVCAIFPTSIILPSPTFIPSSTQPQPDLLPPEINFIKPRSNDLVDTSPSATIKISDTGSGVNLNSVRINIKEVVLTSIDPNFSVAGNSASYTITVKFKYPLSPNTGYFLTVYASDLAGNPIAKSINIKTSTPIITQFQVKKYNLSALFPFIVLIVLLLIYLANKLKYLSSLDSQTIGLVYNSLTLEPLSDITVHIDNQNIKSNIFGLIATKPSLKNTTITINDPDFAFNKPLTPYPYYNLPLAPYKNKSLAYKIHQILLPRPGKITNSTGEAQVGLKLGLIETKFNTLVTARITDSNGHYRFLVPHGRYNLVLFGTNTILKTYDTRHHVNGHTVLNENLVIAR